MKTLIYIISLYLILIFFYLPIKFYYYETEWMFDKKIINLNMKDIFLSKTYWGGKKYNIYRPIFLLSNKIRVLLFKDNYSLYFFSSYFVHLINIILVFFFLKKISNNLFFVNLTVLLFALHPIQSEIIFFTLAFNYAVGFTLMISSLIFFINYCETSLKKYLFLSLFFYFLFLLCIEFSYVYPLLISFIYILYKNKFSLKEWIFKIIPYFGLLIIFFLFLYYGLDIKKRDMPADGKKYELFEIINNKQYTKIPAFTAKMFVRSIRPYIFLGKRITHFENNKSKLNIFYFWLAISIIVFLCLYYKVLLNKSAVFFLFAYYIMLSPFFFQQNGASPNVFYTVFRHYYYGSIFLFAFFSYIISKIVNRRIYQLIIILFLFYLFIFHYIITNEIKKNDFELSPIIIQNLFSD